MPQDPILLAAFIAAFLGGLLLVLGVASILGRMLAVEPEALAAWRADRPDSGHILAAWHLVKDLSRRRAKKAAFFDSMRAKAGPNLLKAGHPTEYTVDHFIGDSISQGILVFLGMMATSLVLFRSPMFFLSATLGLLWALYIRPHQLASAAERRVRQVSRRLPMAIDLAVLVLESGGTLTEGLVLASKGKPGEPFAQEVRMALEGMSAGQSQSKALQDMADRLGLEDLATLVLAINRGEEMGAPMKQTLRTQSDVIRYRRFQRAEKLISEAPVKMMVPNMMIMFATLLVVLAPALIKLATDDNF